MRISDWSSDVCSSDLSQDENGKHCGADAVPSTGCVCHGAHPLGIPAGSGAATEARSARGRGRARKTAMQPRMAAATAVVCATSMTMPGSITRSPGLPLCSDKVTKAAAKAVVVAFSRSDERRVGKECSRTCISRWAPDHQNKKKIKHKI